MQVSEDPGFYGPTPPKGQGLSEYAHVGSLDGSDVEHDHFPSVSKRYGSYIVRAPPTSSRVSTHVDAEFTHARRRQGGRKPSRTHGARHFEILDPLVEESLQRSLSQQNRLSCIATPTKAQSLPSPGSPPSESRRHRTLSRFTKELERYCVAASTNGRVPLPPSTPTVSESPTTLGTVTEFLPYHKQFKAAGLAVTSREQMPRISASGHPQVPAKHAGRTRGIDMVRLQVDGSTVTPSEKETVIQYPYSLVSPDLVVPGREDTTSSKSQPKLQIRRAQPQPQAKPTTKSLLPWFLKMKSSLASSTHGDRRVSKDHIHPSQATPVEPFLSPAGLIDSYFDVLQPAEPHDEHSTERKTYASSHLPSTMSSRTDKPLPKQPSLKRRPIPPRSERRHMENTAEWPTAGVLIHENIPLPPSRDESTGISDAPHQPEESFPAHSWTVIGDELPEEPQRIVPVPLQTASDTSIFEDEIPEEPLRIPPGPPKMTTDTTSTLSREKPAAPPKNESPNESDHQEPRRHHPGHSICNKWHKANGMHHRSAFKPLLVPKTIGEEAEASEDEPGAALQIESKSDATAPRLAIELPYPLEQTSSFERALDAVISKLDDMEERRQYERQMDLQAAHRAVTKSEPPEKASTKTASSKPPSAPRSEQPASATAPSATAPSAARSSPAASSATPCEAVPSSQASMERSDKDMSDRDILVGLKMAICAACDEDLDAWICSKTGLRLRRFLADLKAFELVSQDRYASQPTSISRRIRRSGKQNRRMQERKQSTTKRWSQCFGTDGQASVDESSKEEVQQTSALE